MCLDRRRSDHLPLPRLLLPQPLLRQLQSRHQCLSSKLQPGLIAARLELSYRPQFEERQLLAGEAGLRIASWLELLRSRRLKSQMRLEIEHMLLAGPHSPDIEQHW